VAKLLRILQREHALKVQTDVCIREETFGPFATWFICNSMAVNRLRAAQKGIRKVCKPQRMINGAARRHSQSLIAHH
jgi:hypothetical protein